MPHRPSDSSRSPHAAPLAADPVLAREMERLHRLGVWGRWCLVIGLWLTIGALSLWHLRDDIALMLDYFTWASVKYTIAFNRVPSMGLGLCIGITAGVLIWQSRNILFGLPDRERKQLAQRVIQIREKGPKHPLWRYVCRPPKKR